MKYLKIQNKGELNKDLFYLLGASTKKKDDTKIGQFGTGMKYAISFLLRTQTDFHFFIGNSELNFQVETKEINGNEFETISLDSKSLNITTDYGYQWQAWEAIREIYCNAKDEGLFSVSLSEDIEPREGSTTIFIEMNEDVKAVYDNWEQYFIHEKPIFDDENYAIYKNEKFENCRIYKNGILVKQMEIPSLFNYDIKHGELNELRQYMGYVPHDITKILLNSNREVIDHYLTRVLDKTGAEKVIEDNLDFSFVYGYSKEKVFELFSGRVYLHETSTAEQNLLLLKVDKNLFSILESCGLECEIVKKTYGGGWYGGSSYEKDDKIYHKEFEVEGLRERINKILDKHSSRFIYSTILDLSGKEFDFVCDSIGTILFNANISSLNDIDLEVIVVSAIVQKQEKGIYGSYKRLLKRALNDKFIKKAIFKKNE